MTFYNYIENVRGRCIERFGCQGQRGAMDKAYVSENLDQARHEYDRLKAENTQLREQIELYEMRGRIAEQSLSSSMADGLAFAVENVALHTQLAGVTASMGCVEERCAKLRELTSIMAERDVLLPCMTSCNPHDCRFYDSDICSRIANLTRELGVEMPS